MGMSAKKEYNFEPPKYEGTDETELKIESSKKLYHIDTVSGVALILAILCLVILWKTTDITKENNADVIDLITDISLEQSDISLNIKNLKTDFQKNQLLKHMDKINNIDESIDFIIKNSNDQTIIQEAKALKEQFIIFSNISKLTKAPVQKISDTTSEITNTLTKPDIKDKVIDNSELIEMKKLKNDIKKAMDKIEDKNKSTEKEVSKVKETVKNETKVKKVEETKIEEKKESTVKETK